GVTVKSAAIRDRSEFRAANQAGGYVGVELGADAFADVDLDDFMVFGNDAARAKRFFAELFYKHIGAVLADSGNPPGSADDLIHDAFTQANAFEELVRAAEGVPRDAINIVALASI